MQAVKTKAESPSLEQAQRDVERKIRERGEALLRYFSRRVANEQRVEDLYQETLMRAWASRPDHLEQDERWVRRCMTIARNLFIDEWRRARAEKLRMEKYAKRRQADAQQTQTPLEALLEKELAEAAERIVKELPSMYEQTLRLKAAGLSSKEMARVMNVKIDTAQARLRRARQLVQERLKTLGH